MPPSLPVGTIANRIQKGKVVPFFGAGVSMVGRKGAFQQGTNLPSGSELGKFLQVDTGVTYPGQDGDLLRIAQWIELELGVPDLHESLRSVFPLATLNPTCVHEFFAEVAPPDHSPHLLVTTNYDDLMEEAFRRAGISFDVVVYASHGDNRGKCVLFREGKKPYVFNDPNDEEGHRLLRERPLILKIHGSVAAEAGHESFVISEDDYFEYRIEILRQLPAQLKERLSNSHMLFLGYSLADWNLRMLLYRIWNQTDRKVQTHWSINLNDDPVEKEIWERRKLRMYSADLAGFIKDLKEELSS